MEVNHGLIHAGNMMWTVHDDYVNKRQIKRYGKLHRAEFTSCMKRMEIFLNQLNNTDASSAVRLGFIHREGRGLLAVGNERTPSSKESRLYFHLHMRLRRVDLLGIGDKDSQKRDITLHRQSIVTLREQLGENEYE